MEGIVSPLCFALIPILLKPVHTLSRKSSVRPYTASFCRSGAACSCPYLRTGVDKVWTRSIRQ